MTDFESAIEAAVQRTGPAVVGLRGRWGGGSGTVISPGRILTSAHNLQHPEVTVIFSDGRSETGRVSGTDATVDLAVLEVDTGQAEPVSRLAKQAPPATVGRPIVALARTGSRGLHVTPGFVSSVTASFRGPGGRNMSGAIEHTAPLPRGSSGGPLVDLDGRLLALNSVRMDAGLVLAIPLHGRTAERVEALSRGEQRQTVRLGIAVAPPRAARRLRAAVGLPPRDGILIRAVQGATPADRAGLQRGDLIITAAGRPLDSLDGLYDVLDVAAPGEQLELGLVRGTDEHTVSVELEAA
jgi:serine protease Do